MSAKNTLSATNLALYHHYNCDLYVHNVYNDNRRKSTRQDPPEISKAHFKRGNDWEAFLFSWLDENDLLLTIPSMPVNGSDLIENLLADGRDHFFLAGLSFWPPNDELKIKFFEAGVEPINFGLAKPDLLEFTRTSEGLFTWKVIDAKASNAVKVS